jgi:aryl-alcohol dehydrogenase-like predicted oxidoreductase
MQRTVEGVLIPMAEELGLGALPWGPLKSDARTGKYTGANDAKMQGLRGARSGEFTEKQYDIIDVVGEIAAACNTDSSTVALSGLKAQSGVSSISVGARTLEQLDANHKALDLTRTPEQITSLNTVPKPMLNFPADFLAHSPSFSHAGATVNGVLSQLTLVFWFWSLCMYVM